MRVRRCAGLAYHRVEWSGVETYLQDAGPVHFGLTCAVQCATKDDTILLCVSGSFKNS